MAKVGLAKHKGRRKLGRKKRRNVLLSGEIKKQEGDYGKRKNKNKKKSITRSA